MTEPILHVDDLTMHYTTRAGDVSAVDNVSFSLVKGESLGLVGESGCGKTSVAICLLKLLPDNAHIKGGHIYLNGVDLVPLSEEQVRRYRWRRISMIFQAAMNSLNPVYKVGDQIIEAMETHLENFSYPAAREKVAELFRLVGLDPALMEQYPHEYSGGMRQRAVIAMALITNPKLVLLDEPTSALDVLTQANIMNSLKRIKQEFDVTYILITHDIATSSELADEVLVMYAGHLVEHSPAEVFYKNPTHPYAQKLMASVPTLREDKALEFIPGRPPSLINPPKGCRFAPRCPKRFEMCDQEPPLFSLDGGRVVKCWLVR